MKSYSVQQVSELLNIPKDTLRYYDKLKLLDVKKRIESPSDLIMANELVIDVFQKIRGEYHEK